MVGHDDEGEEFVEAFGAIVLQGLGEEAGVGVGLQDAASVVGYGRDEEGAGVGGSGRVRHGKDFRGWAECFEMDFDAGDSVIRGSRWKGTASAGPMQGLFPSPPL